MSSVLPKSTDSLSVHSVHYVICDLSSPFEVPLPIPDLRTRDNDEALEPSVDLLESVYSMQPTKSVDARGVALEVGTNRYSLSVPTASRDNYPGT